MCERRLAVLVPELAGVISADRPMCVTFESPEGNPWLQAMRSKSSRGAARLWYPFDAEPAQALRRAGLWSLPELAVYEWDGAGRTATLMFGLPAGGPAEAARRLAEWVDAAFERLYAYGDRADLEIDVLPMGPFNG